MLHWHWQLVALCALSLLATVATAAFVIWRYEGPRDAGGDVRLPGTVFDDEAWRPCLRDVHPLWLLSYRLVCFVLFSVLAVVTIHRDDTLLYYYTEWTFLLVTIYFGLATAMSVYGCRKFDPKTVDGQEDREVAGFWGYLLQIIYQTVAGAAMLTDCVFWMLLFPYLRRHGRRTDFWMVMPHAFNAVFLLGDAALNSMCFPWFRVAYFFLWTASYVTFQWIVHAATAIHWWPYPFLDLSSSWSPLWYILAGLMQIPCYMLFMFAMNLKRRAWSKFFPAAFVTSGADGQMSV